MSTTGLVVLLCILVAVISIAALVGLVDHIRTRRRIERRLREIADQFWRDATKRDRLP